MTVAFGNQTARFDSSGIHPDRKLRGYFIQYGYTKEATSGQMQDIAPGKYDIHKFNGSFDPETVTRRQLRSAGWGKAHETELNARRPHLLYIDNAKAREEASTNLGPSTYFLKNTFGQPDIPSYTQGPIFPRSKRFKTVFKAAANSCPGTYGKGGIPHARMEEANKRPITSIGSFDSGRQVDRSMPLFGSDLAPGRYEYKSFTEEVLARQISKRGPFDITTGPRDGRIKKKSDLGPGHYNNQSFTENMQKGTRINHGKFGALKLDAKPGERVFYSTTSQCPNTMKVGPGSYDISRPVTESFNRHPKPFNSSAERFNKHTDKYFKANPNSVGVGRYDIRKYKPPRKGETRALFNSKTERFLDPKSTKYFNERIRSKDTYFADQMEKNRALSI